MSNERVKQIVTDRIIAALERGSAPWKQPWFAIGKGNISGHVYRGINRMTLACSEDTLFMTFNQARNLGGNVRKGEKGWPVVLWKWFTKEEGAEDTERAEAERVPWVTYYTVFGLSQIENIDAAKIKDIKQPERRNLPDVEINHFIELTGARIISHDLAEAFYKPSEDYINIPRIGQFENTGKYYSVLLHELGHWTGHAVRCNRRIKNRFGSVAYGREELTAELFSAMAGYEFGVADFDQAAGYIESWLKAIREDSGLLWWAASQAEKALTWVKEATIKALDKEVKAS